LAALNVLNGTVLTDCKARHRHQEFLAFLRRLEHSVPEKLDIHLIVDNYSALSTRGVKVWLAKRPRWHLHSFPLTAPGSNQVERFFSLITDKAIRRGPSAASKSWWARSTTSLTQYNKHCKPFTWTATADSVLVKLERLTSRIAGQDTS